MEHHLENVSMGVIDTRNLNHSVHTNSDHLTINFLLHTDVCSLGLEFMHEPYWQYDVKSLAIKGCEPFLQDRLCMGPETTSFKTCKVGVSKISKKCYNDLL